MKAPRMLAAALLLVLPAGRLAAQPPEAERPVLVSGTAVAELDGRRVSIPYSLTPSGPLFALPHLVAALGGTLELGPLGQSHTVELPALRAVLGPGSPAMTIGQEILPLSQPPLPGAGGLHVPLDLLRQLYGPTLGYEFSWDPAAAVLTVRRRPQQEIPVTVDLVHLQGVTTVVLQFPRQPRYRVVRREGAVEVELAGDRLRAAEPLRLPEDALVEAVEVAPAGVRIRLARGTAADDYVLRNPFRLVFDVHRAPGAGAPAADARQGPPAAVEGVRTVVVDPGHGGGETGAIGRSGIAEKELTLQLARTLKRRLEARLPVRVVLTRDEDADLPLATRTALANQNKADLFLSLHLNSSLGPEAHGAETYFLSLQASDERAAAAAAAENRAASAGGGDPLYDLQLILWDLAQSRYLTESQRLANLIQEELNGALGLRDRGVKQAPFRVLMGAAMPAVLVELGFLSNPADEEKLQSPGYRADLVEALVRAITRYKAQVEGGGSAPAGGARP